MGIITELTWFVKRKRAERAAISPVPIPMDVDPPGAEVNVFPNMTGQQCPMADGETVLIEDSINRVDGEGSSEVELGENDEDEGEGPLRQASPMQVER